MDEIISKFENLSTDKSEMDDLILKISNINIKDSLFEWNRLQQNFERLKHFKKIYSNVDLRYYESIFKITFLKFMEKIDELNQYYLKNIELEPEAYNDTEGFNIYDLSSIRDIISIIYKSLDNSMNSNDPNKKLDYVLIAYSNIILLVDDLKGDSCVKISDTSDSANFYQSKIKRRR
jgi:hypothetical protein